MKSKISIWLVVALTLSLAACDTVRVGVPEGTTRGSGKLAMEQRPVSGVREVVLTTVGTLVIEQKGQEGLALEGEDNILGFIRTDVKGGRLTIAAKPGSSFTTTKSLTYRLAVKNLTYIGNMASGEVLLKALEGESVVMEANSSGRMKVDNLTATRLSVRISSSGDISVSGRVDEQDATLSSAGNYDARDLESKRAVVRCSSSGSANIKVSDTLDATVSSAGNIRYTGSPEVSESDSGSGSIRQEGR